ncbi:MAG: prepilin-type N-terminal cleavage/methylation domain-containing protein [bacterium]|nr:prepilin-type N-terminal cleavage/methylation domain-containing protein [bacterium]
MKIFSRDSSGFTLVELLLGIALFAILIPAIINMLNSIAAANDNAKDLAIVNIAAENKIEELRSLGFNSLNAGTTDFTTTLPQTIGSPKSANYTIEAPTGGLKKVTITVNFHNRRGDHTLKYQTLVGELGVGQ